MFIYPKSALYAFEVLDMIRKLLKKPAPYRDVVFLPYLPCKDKWQDILYKEMLAGCAAADLLAVFKSDAPEGSRSIQVNANRIGSPCVGRQ